jgi:polysaccharide export outer membrane protein
MGTAFLKGCMKKSLFLFLLCAGVFSARGQVQEYILQSGDVISISVVEHPEFSGRHKIRPDGRINYPVIGELECASLTTAQLVKVMQGKLASYVNNPVVSVAIEAYYANKIFIIGDVRNTGEYEIYEPIDAIKALAMCGGLKNPKTKFIKIIRADGTVVNINMKAFWGSGAQRDTQKYLLYPGDTMYAPEGFTIPWAMISTVLGVVSASLAVILTVMTLGSK